MARTGALTRVLRRSKGKKKLIQLDIDIDISCPRRQVAICYCRFLKNVKEHKLNFQNATMERQGGEKIAIYM